MKQFFIKAMIFAALVIQFSSCQKDEEESVLGSLEVTVSASEAYTGLDTKDIEVKVTNTLDNSVTEATTNSLGVALFVDLAPGTYSVSASKLLTAEAAFEYTGLNNEVTLNATKADIVILPQEEKAEAIVLDGKSGGALVISEIYSTGAANDAYSIMFKDQFVEIYNNSEEVEYVDGLYLAYLAPQRAGSDPTSEVVTTLPIGDNVYASKILQFPGSGTDYPVEPGTAIRVALNAINYLEATPEAYTTDNSTADFDTYAVDWLQSLARTGNPYFDIDNPDVPTMNCIYLFVANGGFFNLDNAPSLALLELDANPAIEANIVSDPDVTSQLSYVKLPADAIIDGVDVLETSGASAYKRLPSAIDAGFAYVIDLGNSNYTGKSLRRKVSKTLANGRVVLMDTNNSGNDFEADFVTVR